MNSHFENNGKCPVCRRGELKRLFRGRDYITSEEFSVYGCPSCGLAVTGLQPDKKGMVGYYCGNYYGKRKSFTENLINSARARIVSKFFSNKSAPSLLDIGCGNGSFLMTMRRRGWLASGTEIAPSGHIKGGAGEFIKNGDFRNSGFSADSFDVVTMWHSLEHVEDPLGYFAEAGKILGPNGILLIEIPNFRSWQARIFRTNWFHLDVPRHLLHFSPESARILFKEAGFGGVTVKTGSFIYGFFGCLQSALNIFSARKNLFFDFLNGKISTGYIVKNNKKDAFLNVILFIPALIFSVLLFLAETLTGNSGVILVFARKLV